MLNVALQSLAHWRVQKIGPKPIYLSRRCVRYSERTLREGAMVILANGERHFVAETEKIIDDMIDTAERLHPLVNDRKETQQSKHFGRCRSCPPSLFLCSLRESVKILYGELT